MATRKSSSKRTSAAAAAPTPSPTPDVELNARGRLHNSDDLQKRSALIGSDPADTMDRCATVLGFLQEFHCRESPNADDEALEYGEFLILWTVKDALERQAKALDAIGVEEVPNG